MNMMTTLAALCAFAAVATLVAYIVGVRRIRGGRPLATLSLFATAMALWQLSMALLYGLGAGAHMNIVYGAAFLLLAGVSQVAGAFRVRDRATDRGIDRETAPAASRPLPNPS